MAVKSGQLSDDADTYKSYRRSANNLYAKYQTQIYLQLLKIDY